MKKNKISNSILKPKSKPPVGSPLGFQTLPEISRLLHLRNKGASGALRRRRRERAAYQKLVRFLVSFLSPVRFADQQLP
ncbi:hypothetical protein LINPERPRIM_LOCUS1259 [Linum perenne]